MMIGLDKNLLRKVKFSKILDKNIIDLDIIEIEITFQDKREIDDIIWNIVWKYLTDKQKSESMSLTDAKLYFLDNEHNNIIMSPRLGAYVKDNIISKIIPISVDIFSSCYKIVENGDTEIYINQNLRWDQHLFISYDHRDFFNYEIISEKENKLTSTEKVITVKIYIKKDLIVEYKTIDLGVNY